MKRKYGTVALGIRAPIISEGDDLVKIAVDATVAAAKQSKLKLSDADILGVTESVLAMSQGNYVSCDDIGADIKTKFDGQEIAVIHPILSRNRFANILKGVAKGAKKVFVLLDHMDEQGNALSQNINIYKPDTNLYTAKEYVAKYGESIHPITGANHIQMYEKLGDNIEVLIGSDPSSMLDLTKNVIVATVHSRDMMKDYLIEKGAKKIYTLADIMSCPIGQSGFNAEFGVLGSNYAGDERLKLFPRDCDKFVNAVQKEFFRQLKVLPQIMIFGDGAYKDPSTGIWELADPVVSPGYTSGLGQVAKGDTKLKAVALTELADLSPSEKEKRLNEIILKNKNNANEAQLGTTPRKDIDLLGSLMDLASGSGNKGTPFVLVHGYRDTRADEEINLGI